MQFIIKRFGQFLTQPNEEDKAIPDNFELI